MEITGITPSYISPSTVSSAPLIYYLGYATQENMRWIEDFKVDVLTRGFLLFLNSTNNWLTDYRPRMAKLQDEGRKFMVALQAAVLVERREDIPALGSEDPALAYPMDSIPHWEEYTCHKQIRKNQMEQNQKSASCNGVYHNHIHFHHLLIMVNIST